MNPADALSAADWLTLWLHFLSLSLLAVGGAITTAPDMHRYLVGSQHWLSDAQFIASIAIAQAAPGPNVLFVALVGWHVGLNAGGGPAGGWHAQGLALLGAAVAMLGILLPSGVLTYSATRWAHQRRELRAVRLAPEIRGFYRLFRLFGNGRVASAAKAVAAWFGTEVRLHG